MHDLADDKSEIVGYAMPLRHFTPPSYESTPVGNNNSSDTVQERFSSFIPLFPKTFDRSTVLCCSCSKGKRKKNLVSENCKNFHFEC